MSLCSNEDRQDPNPSSILWLSVAVAATLQICLPAWTCERAAAKLGITWPEALTETIMSLRGRGCLRLKAVQGSFC